MAMTEEKRKERNSERPHSVIMENRQRLSVSGVEDVDSFDEERIVLYTTMGLLEIQGTGMHISHLNVENGEIAVEGMVDSMEYTDEDAKRMSFLQRLLR
ncbi:MAG: sporulation protein YabP [Eubacteriales bacterium]|jgi:sporulation protein YabP